MSCAVGESCFGMISPSVLDALPSSSIPALAKKYRLGSGFEVRLPGEGELGDRCGVAQGMVCHSCGTFFFAEHSCMGRDCPNCFRKWAYREGKIASFRLWAGASSVAQAIERRYWRLLHVIVSFPDEAEAYRTSRERVYRVCKEHGIAGGTVIFHPFRKSDDAGFVPDGYLHYHVLGLAFGDVKPGGQERDGRLVFKVVPDARTGDFRGFCSPYHLKDCVGYQLTHCGIVDDRHAVTWFGVLSYNKMSTEALKAYSPEGYDATHSYLGVSCPECHSRDTELFSNEQDIGRRSREIEPVRHGWGHRKRLSESEYFLRGV